MARDPKSILRLAAVQEHKRQLAQWKVAAADAALAQLARDREDLLAALDGNLSNDLLVPLVSRRVSALDRDVSAVEARRIDAEANFQNESRRARLAERLRDSALREQERSQEAVDLEHALETWRAPGTQGSNKLGET